MEGDAGRDANKSFGYPPNTPVMELEYILTLKG